VDRDSPFLTVETVRAEGAWLRRLAVALTGGQAAADDALQETWLAGVAHPPRSGGAPGGWLRVVLRNAARKGARADVRRQAREAHASGEHGVPSIEELAVRLEAQQLVAQLVMRLEEPYRTTVLLCYYEGLAPIEIASRQAVPPGTVRWRLKHALDQLRAQLDRAHADRRPWRALLAPLASTSERTSLLAKGILVTKATKGVLVAVGILLALMAGGLGVQRLAANRAQPAADEAAPQVAASDPAAPSPRSTTHPLGSYRKGARTAVPRFTAAPVAPDAAIRAFTRPPRLEPMGSAGVRNRFDHEPPNFKDIQRRVHEKLAAMNERAEKCLENFSADDPSLKPGVMLGISLDPAGLQSVWIEDRVDVPEGPLTCFANAVYELDWSGIIDRPAQLTQRIHYQSPDAAR
jgi:RNA polymerase sigma factor (sigma-70 family)